ncbi:MAG: NAD(P)-dependent oxidoreductase [Bacteroidetes bacterium]|nr:NAD(P)-dependent oxidoreductase [Bacteroidota bacterium]
MKLALIGASGFVGTQLLKEALHRGHTVTAIVRHPDKITIKDDNLTVKQGDVLNETATAALLTGHDAVISAYNAGWSNPDIYNDFIKGSQAIENAVVNSGVKRLLVVGGAGSLEIAPGKQLVDTPEFPAEWKSGALAARDYLNMLKKNNTLDWTFVSPAIMLHPGERTGKYRIGQDQPVFDVNGKSEISAEDLAVAILDEAEQPKFIKKRFTAAY